MESSDFVSLLIPTTILIIAVGVLTIGETLFLRKKEWLSKSPSFVYPIVSNIVSIPVAVIVPIVSAVAFLVFGYFVIGAIHFNIRDDFPTSAEALGKVFNASFYVVPFLVSFVAFVVVRSLTTAFIAKFPNLTWRYVAVQSAILTTVLVFVFIIWTLGFLPTIDPAPFTNEEVPLSNN